MGFLDWLFEKKQHVLVEDITEEEVIVKDSDTILTLKEPDIQIFKGYIGQKNIVEMLKIALINSHKTNTPVGHILLSGYAGYGKSSIARLLAKAIDTECIFITGPRLTENKLTQTLSKIKFGTIVFIDEIHSVQGGLEELLYEAMQDFSIDSKKIPKFTLIGATTRPSSLQKPFRDRFVYDFKMEKYSMDEIEEILEDKSFLDASISFSVPAISAIAGCSRGTPRIALKLLSIVSTVAMAKQEKKVDSLFVYNTLKTYTGIDKSGLSIQDFKYLNTIATNGGSASIKTISSALQEDSSDIQNTVEPFLIENGLVEITNKGRILTKKGFDICVKNT